MLQLLAYLGVFILGLAFGALYNNPIVRGLIHMDKEVNDEFLGGRDGETISTRAGRAIKWRVNVGKPDRWDWIWVVLSKILNLFDENHCVRDYERVYGVYGERDPLRPPV